MGKIKKDRDTETKRKMKRDKNRKKENNKNKEREGDKERQREKQQQNTGGNKQRCFLRSIPELRPTRRISTEGNAVISDVTLSALMPPSP